MPLPRARSVAEQGVGLSMLGASIRISASKGGAAPLTGNKANPLIQNYPIPLDPQLKEPDLLHFNGMLESAVACSPLTLSSCMPSLPRSIPSYVVRAGASEASVNATRSTTGWEHPFHFSLKRSVCQED
ncbi:unnamed protein product [Lota lota]